MFTGLVEGRAAVVEFERDRGGARLILSRPELGRGLARWAPVLGESLSVSGCCLSVTAVGRSGRTTFDLSRETLSLTWFGGLARDAARERRPVNVERSLRLGERLGGHLVSGHVDALGRIAAIEDSRDGGRLFTFEVPQGFERSLIDKGSVTIDGISLTVVAPVRRRFQVAVIPETLRRTTLGVSRVGDAVHLEGDMIGKWVERLMGSRGR